MFDRWPWRRRAPKRYRAKDFQGRERYRCDYRTLASSLLHVLAFDSVLDVGCANGFLLAAFQEAGKAVAGIEDSPAVREVLPPALRAVVEVGDFSLVSLVHGTWDLVSCVEVAEHIEPRRSAELVATLTGAARRFIYFTAAPPGQGGRGHINCRPHDEWIELFAARGWEVDEAATAALRRDLESLENAPWLRGNSLILRPRPAPAGLRA